MIGYFHKNNITVLPLNVDLNKNILQNKIFFGDGWATEKEQTSIWLDILSTVFFVDGEGSLSIFASTFLKEAISPLSCGEQFNVIFIPKGS